MKPMHGFLIHDENITCFKFLETAYGNLNFELVENDQFLTCTD